MKFKTFKVIQTKIQATQAQKNKVVETLEGDVICNKGDYIVTGIKGEKYPVVQEKFEKKYEKVSNDMYQKKKGEVQAFKLDSDFSVQLTSGRGVLQGNKGDYLVTSPNTFTGVVTEDDLKGVDVWVVNGDIFPELYE